MEIIGGNPDYINMKYYVFEIEIVLGFPQLVIVKAQNLACAEKIMENKYCGLDYYHNGDVSEILE